MEMSFESINVVMIRHGHEGNVVSVVLGSAGFGLGGEMREERSTFVRETMLVLGRINVTQLNDQAELVEWARQVLRRRRSMPQPPGSDYGASSLLRGSRTASTKPSHSHFGLR